MSEMPWPFSAIIYRLLISVLGRPRRLIAGRTSARFASSDAALFVMPPATLAAVSTKASTSRRRRPEAMVHMPVNAALRVAAVVSDAKCRDDTQRHESRLHQRHAGQRPPSQKC